MTTLVLTSAEKDTQSTVLMKTNSDFREKFQRVVLQIEDQSVQGCSQKKGELLSYSQITFAISWWIIVIGNSGVKYITCYRSDGQSPINHCRCAPLQMIIINGSALPSKQSWGLKRTHLLLCSLEKIIPRTHCTKKITQFQTAGLWKMNDCQRANHFWVLWP